MSVPRGWHYPRVIAHRGGGTVAPENTLAGMREAHARGLRGVEFDVMLAGDGVPVLMHDPDLGRTVAGRGSIAALASAELAAMDAGAWLDPRFAGENVPLFADAYRWLTGAGLWMNIEIKPAPGHDDATGRVVGQLTAELLAAHPPRAGAAPPLFSSFSEVALEAARAAAPEVARALLWSHIPGDWEARLSALDCVAVHCNHRNLDARLAAHVKQAGYGLMCYTVNDPARARELLAWGVDAFCTDRIDLFSADFT